MMSKGQLVALGSVATVAVVGTAYLLWKRARRLDNNEKAALQEAEEKKRAKLEKLNDTFKKGINIQDASLAATNTHSIPTLAANAQSREQKVARLVKYLPTSEAAQLCYKCGLGGHLSRNCPTSGTSCGGTGRGGGGGTRKYKDKVWGVGVVTGDSLCV